MTEHRPKILVLGSDTRSFLTVIRSLGRIGAEVHAAWVARDSVSVSSKYLAKRHHPTRPPSKGWKPEFRELLERERFDLIIPCNDPSILPLHAEREYFAGFPIYLISDRIFDTVMDKVAVNEIAAKVGMRLAKEVVIRHRDDMGLLDSLSLPHVLKPTHSYVSEDLGKKNHVVIARSKKTSLATLSEMLDKTQVAAQEYFEGHGVGVEFIAHEGEVLSAFQHQRLHEPPDGGGSSYRISCKLDPALLAETKSLVNELGYTGIGMAEYRYHSKRKDWIFVELNSRFWGSLPLAVNCGADFPRYLYEMLCEDKRDFPTDYQVGKTCRNWMLDARWLSKTCSANGVSLTKHFATAWQLMSELRFPLTFRESCDTLPLDDLGPGVREIRETVSRVPKRLQAKVGKKVRALAPVRQRARRRLHRVLSNVQKVLFVCKGNICRSPFAERYAAAHIDRWRLVASSGYFPRQDRPSPENAVKAAAEFGVDLLPHRSSVVSAELVKDFDAIIVFDDENMGELKARFPFAKRRIHFLGTLLDETGTEIIDPYGGEVDDFRTIYGKISRAIDLIAGVGDGRTSSA